MTKTSGFIHTARRILTNEIFWLLVIALSAAAFFIYFRNPAPAESKQTNKDERMLFVGDIMLARSVETQMNSKGLYHPFKGLRDMLLEYDAVVGNFEGSIPKQHIQTPGYSMTFSVGKEVATVLPRVGITHLSLANNHSYDYGKDGYDNAREVLADAGLNVGGNPKTVSADEVLYKTIDGVRVAIIPINTIFGAPSATEIKKVFADIEEKSDIQIVFIHWGEEYELVANKEQRSLARALIDQGADAIIGSHPHVVQNIEEYRGAPIFYSLGNCIFDQYWNEDVQTGLSVALSFTDKTMQFTLLPISSIDERSVPRPMNRIERLQFLDTLAERSQKSLEDAIKEGVITELFGGSKDTP